MAGEARYPVTETKDVLIPMSDGTRLAANLLLPDGSGPVPAIVVYFPYLKDGPNGRGDIHVWQLHFAERGYACLTVDIRGTGASDGTAAPPNSSSEKEDAYELLAWIAAQPWCDGTTGMWGKSYSASTALAAASLQPPSLKAIIPLHGTANEFIGFLRPHGCRPGWWTEASWGPTMVLFSMLPPLHRDGSRRWARIWRDRLESFDPWPFSWHTTSFDEYMAWRSDASAVRAATYAVSGWHDYYAQATLDYFNDIPAPKRVLIGPWKHETPDRSPIGAIDHRHEMDRWWDQWLKGVDTGITVDPPVIIWRQGDDEWGYEQEWPPLSSESQHWFAGPGGSLIRSAPTESGFDTYLVDPTVGLDLLAWDPQAPTVGDRYDRSGDDHRSLTYTSEPLDAPATIQGAPEAILHLSSDCSEFPLSVWLSDVAPNGRSSLVCQGWTSAALLAGQPLGAGRSYELRVQLYSTSYRIQAGHRLRLGIAGSCFPLLWPAPERGSLEVERSPARPTRLSLPVLPEGRVERPGPVFSVPQAERSLGRSPKPSENRIVRELDGTLGAFHQFDEWVTVLEDAVVTLKLRNASTVRTASSVETVMTAHLEAVVETGGDRVDVTVESLQTNERFVVEGRIELNRAPFFHRTWELPLNE